ncbi:outer membrane autotransporter protein [Phyllobacterium ifriqiyense]|uniref:Outer membrane autotransporter protein n=1 Tax=Phyllobacterium ifriqiyense TaxID=314238 RepID=A0ABU0S640_9HYPH|nr:outer membrane autotransporter protein [Phyllobacterium ifriqiyense]
MSKQPKNTRMMSAARISVLASAVMVLEAGTALPALAADAGDNTLRIISLNTWGARNLNPTAWGLFANGKYDVITIQEYNGAYGSDLVAKLPSYLLHSNGDTGLASTLPMTTGLAGVQKTPFMKIDAEGGRPVTIVATEHLNYWDDPFDHRVREAKELNDWARSEVNPILMTGDFNAGDISERGLLEVPQQELMLDQARSTGNADYKAWALQYVARNHPIGSAEYQAAEAYINKTSQTRPNGLFTDEMYPVAGNTPNTMNILKKDYQILQNPEDREKFAPHELADGSTTWPSIGEDDEAFKWPSWGRTQIDHFVASRPYAKWWKLEDKANDQYVGGVLGESVSVAPDGIPLSDHEAVAHELRWNGPRVQEIPNADGKVQLIFDSGASGFDGAGEFRLSRNNNRTDVYLGQLADANGTPIYRLPETVPQEAITQDQLAYLVSNAIYDRDGTAPGFLEQLKPFIPEDKMEIFNQRRTELLDSTGDGYYRTVIKSYFEAHRDQYPGKAAYTDLSWEDWGYILMDHVKTDVTFQTVTSDFTKVQKNWEELRTALNLDDPSARAELKRLTGIDFENDHYAPLKLQLACGDVKQLSLQGARDMCVDDHSRFKDIVIADGKTVAIDESEALGLADGTITLANGGIRTAGPDDKWASWTAPVTRIDKAVRLEGIGWIDVSDPAVPVAMVQAISGPGILEKRGVGALDLMTANTYTGGTVVAAGTLRAGMAKAFVNNTPYAVNGGVLDLNNFHLVASSLSGKGGTVKLGNATLDLHQALDTRFDGTIEGTGGLTKSGEGWVILNGANSYTGATAVNGGGLLVGDKDHSGARLAGQVNVATGGTLGGAGTIGGVTVASGGTLAPGNSIGTLSISGDLVLKDGSTYLVDIAPGGSSDKVAAGGKVTIEGGDIYIAKLAGTYMPGQRYAILSAGDSITGTFADLSQNMPFVDMDIAYDPRNVYLDIARNDVAFSTIGLTRNEKASAAAIEALGAGNKVFDAVVMQDSETNARVAFSQLSGEMHASAKTALINDSNLIRDGINDRIRAAFHDVAAAHVPVMGFGPDAKPLGVPVDAPTMAAWANAFGTWSETNGDGNASDLDQVTGGFITGFDAAVATNWRLGALAGYSRSTFYAKGSGESDNYHVGLYGGGRFNALSFRTGLAYSWHSIETSRSVAFPGFEDRLKADYDAGTFQTFGELGYRIDTQRVSFEPFANLAHVRVKTEDFSESGGSAALAAESETTSTTFTTLGLRAAAPFTLGTVEAEARATVGWQHAYGDTTPLSTLAFNGGSAFTIAGAPIAKDTGLIEAGVDVKLGNRTTFGVSYSGQFGSDVRQNGVDARFSVKF